MLHAEIFEDSEEFTIYLEPSNMFNHSKLDISIRELYEKLTIIYKQNVKCIVSDKLYEFNYNDSYILLWKKERYIMGIEKVNHISHIYNESENKYYILITYDITAVYEKKLGIKEFGCELYKAKSIKRQNKIDMIIENDK